MQIEVGNEAGRDEQIDRALAHHLVGDRDPISLDVLRLRRLHDSESTLPVSRMSDRASTGPRLRSLRTTSSTSELTQTYDRSPHQSGRVRPSSRRPQASRSHVHLERDSNGSSRRTPLLIDRTRAEVAEVIDLVAVVLGEHFEARAALLGD